MTFLPEFLFGQVNKKVSIHYYVELKSRLWYVRLNLPLRNVRAPNG